MKLRTFAVASMLLLLCSAAAVAQRPEFPSLSADMKSTGSHGDNSTGKMYFSGPDRHFRMEMNMRGHDAIVIVDSSNEANPRMMMLMPQQHMYMEMNASSAGPGRRAPQVRTYDPNNPCSGRDGDTCKKVGTETVNGYPCDKWEITGKDPSTVWISQQYHFPIKTVNADGSAIEFSNIQTGPQAASLFQVPAGYQKMDMGAMMGHNPNQ